MMKRQFLLMSVLLAAFVLTFSACSDNDNAVPVSDDKPWTINDGDKDKSVRPGDYTAVAERVYSTACNYERNYEYCHRYCDEASVQHVMAICQELKQAFAKRIARNTWLSEASKANILDKLEAMKFYIGRPDQWYEEGLPDLSASTNLMEDVLIAQKTRMKLFMMSIGPIDQFDVVTSAILTGLTSMTFLNCGYDTWYNAVFISPIFCSAPLNPQGVNEAINYAAATVYGHELTHAFDTMGYKRDKYGNPGNVMATNADYQAFNDLTGRLAANYSMLEVMPDALPGLCNDGQTTIAENIADLGGFEVCYEAYTDKLRAGGFTGDGLRLQQQRFFEAYAHVWQSCYNAPYAKRKTQGEGESKADIDTHSLERERVNGVLRNVDAWYDLYDVKPGDKLYLAPEQRVHIW